MGYMCVLVCRHACTTPCVGASKEEIQGQVVGRHTWHLELHAYLAVGWNGII